jgi:hypothetical protein
MTSSAEGRMPDFFIVGHEKCGTTSLYRILRSHPEIFMPDLKEPRFFIRDASTEATQGRGIRPRTLEAYMALFAPAGPEQLAGEASPQYIRSKDAARRIAEAKPDARVIALLREPASFVHTCHLNCVRELVESERDLCKALALEAERLEGRSIPRGCRAPTRLLYGEHVRYVEQLRRLHEAFGPEQVLVLIYEDFRDDNDATVRRVLRFLDVDDTPPLVSVETKRVRKAVRYKRLHRMALAIQRARRQPALAGRASRALDAITPRVLRSGALEDRLRRLIFSVPPPPDERLMLELRRRFEPEVQALGEYLGRDMVSFWGYDDLG